VSGISADNGAAIIQWDWWGGNKVTRKKYPPPIISKTPY